MFGHDDTKEPKDDAVTVTPTDDATNDVNVTPVVDTPAVTSADDDSLESVLETGNTDSPAAPTDAPDVTADTPAVSADGPAIVSPTDDDNEIVNPEDADLLSLKKQALDELTPLIDHLDQSAEEKYKTTMMMIQATDSANLIKNAHEAAKQITDEKVRAQALLDIVNEINYFTQK